MLVRNRARLVEQRTRCRSQLTAIEDVLFPELKDFLNTSVTSPSARLLLESFSTPNHVAAADPQICTVMSCARAMLEDWLVA